MDNNSNSSNSNSSNSNCSNSNSCSSFSTISSCNNQERLQDLCTNELLHPMLSSFKFYTSPSVLQQFESKPEHIDEIIQLEMQHVREKLSEQEQVYVDQMLSDHPIVVERRSSAKKRTMTADSGPSTSAATKATSTTVPTTITTTKKKKTTNESSECPTQRQRAESCRKSRYNNKMKEARMRFRHNFLKKQISERADVLNYIHGIILKAEKQLMDKGFSQSEVDKLRHLYGVDRPMPKFKRTAAMNKFDYDDASD